MLLYAAAMIIWPFITANVLAAVTVILTFPTFRMLSKRMSNSPNRAALVMLLAITLLVVIPFTILGVLIIGVINNGLTLFLRHNS